MTDQSSGKIPMKPNPTENCPLDIEDCVCARCPYRDEMEIEQSGLFFSDSASPWLTRLLVTALGIGALLSVLFLVLLLIRAIAFFDFS